MTHFLIFLIKWTLAQGSPRLLIFWDSFPLLLDWAPTLAEKIDEGLHPSWLMLILLCARPSRFLQRQVALLAAPPVQSCAQQWSLPETPQCQWLRLWCPVWGLAQDPAFSRCVFCIGSGSYHSETRPSSYVSSQALLDHAFPFQSLNSETLKTLSFFQYSGLIHPMDLN